MSGTSAVGTRPVAIPVSAMKRKALPFCSCWAPSRSVFDLKNEACAFFASELSLTLS